MQEKIIKKANITLPKDKLIQQLPKAEVKQHDINLFKSLPNLRFALYDIVNMLKLNPQAKTLNFQKMKKDELNEYIKTHHLPVDMLIDKYNKKLYLIIGRQTPDSIKTRDKRMKRYGIK